jgi:hypothetical protein
VELFGENKRRLHDYTVFVQCISKNPPLIIYENGRKAMILIQSRSYDRISPYQIAGVVVPLYNYSRANQSLRFIHMGIIV